MKRWTLLVVLVPILLPFTPLTASRPRAQSNPASSATKTVWEGVYTAGQAERGKSSYNRYCGYCHGDDLEGGAYDGDLVPALAGDEFMSHSQDLHHVFAFMKRNMPRDKPSILDDDVYTDILAYMLQKNGCPSGAGELKPDVSVLETIRVVKKPN
jgi:quinoprotein glucose dehydrogenase